MFKGSFISHKNANHSITKDNVPPLQKTSDAGSEVLKLFSLLQFTQSLETPTASTTKKLFILFRLIKAYFHCLISVSVLL